MNVKSILDNALIESGFSPALAYATSLSPDDKQPLALLNREAQSLLRFGWSALKKSAEIALVSGTSLYDLPSDFDRLVNDGVWIKNNVRQVELPTDDYKWNAISANGVNAGPNYSARLRNGQLEVYGANTGDTIRIEYYSNTPFTDRLGDTYKCRANVDTDEPLLDDELLTMGVIWRFKKAKGLDDWQADLADYQARLRKALAGNESAQTISMAHPREPILNEPYTDLWVD